MFLNLVDTLEVGCKRAIDILKEKPSKDGVKQASDLIQSELNHLVKVTSNFGKNPKVSGQSKLIFRRLGKTKRSKEILIKKLRQSKMTEYFQKPKVVKRKLVISSDSEDVSGKESERGGLNSPVNDGASVAESMDQDEGETVLASGPDNLGLTNQAENVSKLNKKCYPCWKF